LWTVTPQVFDWNRVSPGDVLNRDAHRSGQPLPFRWARRVVAGDDGFDQLGIQSRCRDELVHAHSRVFQIPRKGFHSEAILSKCQPRITRITRILIRVIRVIRG
jgi:hypothetical protein